MLRRTFLLASAASLLAPFARALRSASALAPPVTILDCRIAGFAHHHGPRLWNALREGDPLTLAREPDNPHDARAVAVHWREARIGYLPRLANRAAARLLDEGAALEARIARLYPDAQYEPLRLEVMMHGLDAR
jgi:hypothetical protein